MDKHEAFQEILKVLQDIDNTDGKILEINKRLKIVLIISTYPRRKRYNANSRWIGTNDKSNWWEPKAINKKW